MGRCDDSRIDLDGSVGSQPTNLSLLKKAEQTDLEGRGGIPNLVQEEGPLVSCFDKPNPIAIRSGERSPRMAE